MAAREQANALTGDPFAGYRDLTPLHTGLYSSVFRAVEERAGRPVALKVLGVEGATVPALERFGREAAVLAALSAHPHIVTLYRSFAMPDGRPVLVLELCRGSIDERLRAGVAFTAREAVATSVKIAGALETAHRGGVLHRDVRPANILITDFGEPALTDFGVARLRSSVPAPAELFEFPSVHVAPELVMGQEPSDATDVYGLASTLYQMLTGHPPLEAYVGESPAATILRILRDPARPIHLDGVPIELSDLLLWGLAKDPADRPPNLMWFAEELGRIEAGQGWTRTHLLVREPGSLVTAAPVRRRLSKPLSARTLITRPDAPATSAPLPAPLPAPPAAPPSGPAAPTTPPPPAPPSDAAPAPGESDTAPATAAPSPPPPIAPPLWAPPQPASGTQADDSAALARHRVVLRGPVLASLGTLLMLVAPIWAALVTTLALTNAPLWVALSAAGGALVLTWAAVRFARPSLVVEGCHMRHRDGLARVLIPWSAVVGFTSQYEPSRRPGAPHGLIVVVGKYASMPLTATRRSTWELNDVVGVLETFRAADSTHHHD